MGYIFDALYGQGDDDELQDESQEDSPQPPRRRASDKVRDPQAPTLEDEARRLKFPVEPPAPENVTVSAADYDDAEVAVSSAADDADIDDDAQDEYDIELNDGPIASVTSARSIENIDERLVALTQPAGIMAEEYRSIRTGMLAKWEHRRRLVHVITSATPQEGKTITSLNLGLIFAEMRNRKTIVVEADLRLPQFEKLMQLPEGPGIVGVLNNQATLGQAIRRVGDSKVDLLPAGRRVPKEAVQLLSSPQMVSLIKSLRKRYDHIIIDTPPVIELSDAGILGAMSDDTLMIVRMNRTPRPLVEQAIRTLASYNAPVAGVIATDHSRTRNRYYGRYGYGYRYRDYNRYYTKAAA